MNSAANMGPVQVAALTYFLCAVISLGVAGIIAVLCHILKVQNNKTTGQTDPSK